MKMKSCSMIVVVMIMAFCLCTEDGNNPAGSGIDERFVGNWTGTDWQDIVYDVNGNVLSDTTTTVEGYYRISSDEVIAYLVTDTCATITGPFSYTFKDDTISYVMTGFFSMNVVVTLENEVLKYTHEMPLLDSTGQAIGKMTTILNHTKYNGSIPESNWATDPCVLF
jgi:hypothetical protein